MLVDSGSIRGVPRALGLPSVRQVSATTLMIFRGVGLDYNGADMRTRILFICIGNTCRSPMAEAIARHLGGDRVDACSAGLSPTGRVSEQALSVLEALGIPAEGLSSKSLEEIDLDSCDVIVSLIGRDGLRWLPRHLPATRVEWEVRDPFGEEEETFLAVARVLLRRIERLLSEIDIPELSST